jgi:hypothetical protein
MMRFLLSLLLLLSVNQLALAVEATEKPLSNSETNFPVAIDNKVKIKKVYAFLNDPKYNPGDRYKPLEFEYKYFSHGAVTQEQLKNKYGNYFIVSWANTEAPGNYELRLDFRQEGSNEKIKSLVIPFNNSKGNHKARFAVTGDTYADFGKVNSWRVSVVRDGTIVAQEKSYIW